MPFEIIFSLFLMICVKYEIFGDFCSSLEKFPRIDTHLSDHFIQYIWKWIRQRSGVYLGYQLEEHSRFLIFRSYFQIGSLELLLTFKVRILWDDIPKAFIFLVLIIFIEFKQIVYYWFSPMTFLIKARVENFQRFYDILFIIHKDEFSQDI